MNRFQIENVIDQHMSNGTLTGDSVIAMLCACIENLCDKDKVMDQGDIEYFLGKEVSDAILVKPRKDWTEEDYKARERAICNEFVESVRSHLEAKFLESIIN